MSEIAIDAARLMDMLPETDKHLAYELIKKLVLAWDPDYTKLTLEEKNALYTAEKEEFFDDQEIDWNNLKQYS